MLREYLVPRRRRLSGALIAVGLVAALSVPAASPKPAPPVKINPIFTYNKSDREQHLYQCAQQEGKVVFYTSSSAATTTLQPAFQKQYPGVSMSVLVATADLPTKLKQEEDAGQHNFDVYGDTLGNLGRDYRYFQPIWTPRQGEVRPYLSKPYYVAYAGFLEGLVYNPNMIGSGDVPRTWKDLLQPKWAGKVYMGIDTGTAGFIGLLDRDLRRHVHRPAVEADPRPAGQRPRDRRPGDRRTIPIGINISSSYHKTNYLDRGQPLRWVPLDPVPGFFQAASISKNAPHPVRRGPARRLADVQGRRAAALEHARQRRAVQGLPAAPVQPEEHLAGGHDPEQVERVHDDEPVLLQGLQNYQAALTAWQKIIQTKFTG